MIMSESLEELKAIIDDAKEFDKTSSAKVKGIKIFDGWYRWFLNDNSYSKIFDNEDYDGVQIDRSLSDIKRIIELMESNSKLQNKSGESFKEELLKATSSMMHPHIEGVYAVWEDQL